MMTDEAKGGQYDTGFERCDTAWMLWEKYIYDQEHILGRYDGISQMNKSYYAYQGHVRDCPKCLAVNGRFAE